MDEFLVLDLREGGLAGLKSVKDADWLLCLVRCGSDGAAIGTGHLAVDPDAVRIWRGWASPSYWWRPALPF